MTCGDYRVLPPLHAGCGRIGRPAFPTPSGFRGKVSSITRAVGAAGMWSCVRCSRALLSAVIARLAAFAKASARRHSQASAKPWRSRDRAIQYSEKAVIERRGRGVLDTPHARGMTAVS